MDSITPREWKISPQYDSYIFSQALVNILKDILLIHYMDDLLLAHSDVVYLQRTVKNVLKDLASFEFWKFSISTQVYSFSF